MHRLQSKFTHESHLNAEVQPFHFSSQQQLFSARLFKEWIVFRWIFSSFDSSIRVILLSSLKFESTWWTLYGDAIKVMFMQRMSDAESNDFLSLFSSRLRYLVYIRIPMIKASFTVWSEVRYVDYHPLIINRLKLKRASQLWQHPATGSPGKSCVSYKYKSRGNHPDLLLELHLDFILYALWEVPMPNLSQTVWANDQ